ncbi:hypothetical protein Tsubulata_044391 [Turnera subulata]|uniref:Uncharacterized protein n=1 Tax=Turnera subulata TaxID=218843 RepID=A0A9Q0FH98_9ROSI|nr:hypothetical protein Tsubulata_044391 [Turnera subulata]
MVNRLKSPRRGSLSSPAARQSRSFLGRVRLALSPIRMRGRLGLDSASLGASSRVVKAREGLESAICLAISRGVVRGLVVVNGNDGPQRHDEKADGEKVDRVRKAHLVLPCPRRGRRRRSP